MKEGLLENRKRNEATAMRGMLIALALMLSYLESFIPTYIVLPGVKIGLANIVTVYALYRLGIKDVFFVCISRIILSALLFGNVLTLAYSLAGMFLSILAMWSAKSVLKASVVTVSVLGSVFHNIGQCIVASLILKNVHILYYFGFVVLIAIFTGIVIGFTARMVMKRLSGLGDGNGLGEILKSDGDTKNIGKIKYDIHSGEVVAVIGENGVGKSAFAQLLAGLEYIDGTLRSRMDADISYNGVNIKDIDNYNKRCSMVRQIPQEGLLFSSVDKDIRFGLENLRGGNSETEEIYKKIYAMQELLFGENDPSKKYHTMCGGELEKAAFLSIYSQQPEILILDEAFNMLGTEGQLLYKKLIEEYKAKKRTLIIVTHDSDVVKMCDYAISVNRSASGNVGLESLDIDEAVGIMEKPEDTIFKSFKIYNSGSDAGSDIKQTEIIKLASYESSDVAVNMKNISYRYDKENEYIVKALSYSFCNRSIYLLKGRSGAGKSTVLRMLGGLLKPVEGEIENRFSKETGYIDQFSEKGFFADTVKDEVMASFEGTGLSAEERKKTSEEEFEFWGIKEDMLDKDPYRLSAGEKKRLSLICMLVRKPKVLLLDEPFAGLDKEGCRKLTHRLKNEAQKGNTVILTMH